jgi:hypothetical protein
LFFDKGEKGASPDPEKEFCKGSRSSANPEKTFMEFRTGRLFFYVEDAGVLQTSLACKWILF